MLGSTLLGSWFTNNLRCPCPPRIAPRNLFDVAVGDDNLFKGDRYKWSLTLTAVNMINKLPLYNFLSTFSGAGMSANV